MPSKGSSDKEDKRATEIQPTAMYHTTIVHPTKLREEENAANDEYKATRGKCSCLHFL